PKPSHLTPARDHVGSSAEGRSRKIQKPGIKPGFQKPTCGPQAPPPAPSTANKIRSHYIINSSAYKRKICDPLLDLKSESGNTPLHFALRGSDTVWNITNRHPERPLSEPALSGPHSRPILA